jgi:hypothetical protein
VAGLLRVVEAVASPPPVAAALHGRQRPQLDRAFLNVEGIEIVAVCWETRRWPRPAASGVNAGPAAAGILFQEAAGQVNAVGAEGSESEEKGLVGWQSIRPA